MIALNDIHWAAGFLEGEGSFHNERTNIALTAAQVQREPLDRLQKIFGGKVYRISAAYCKGGEYHRWNSTGKIAAGVAMTIYTLMSTRRQGQITKALTKWRSKPANAQSAKTHCPKGHEYTPENTYRHPARKQSRQCKACRVRWKANSVFH